MSQEAVEQVLGRLITDERFRTNAGNSLEKATLQAGYRLTPVELKMMCNIEQSCLVELSSRLDAGLCRA